MLKGVKKGLKKKIKGKKSGKDEDDLFDPEQLEKLKRELEEKRKAQAAEEGESSQNGGQSQVQSNPPKQEEGEEWAKFKLLTAGVDAVVKQSSEGLGKIKETSFYQRQVTDPTNLWRPDKGPGAPVEEVVPEPEPEVPVEEEIPEEPTPPAPEDVEPVELDDSLFDTTYLDAIAAGDIHLAYIPDSPVEEEGDDPFNTSFAENVCKRIEAAEKLAARQVNLGSAADFLSGRAATGKELDNSRSRPRAGGAGGRARPRAVNLLGDFDNPENAPKAPIFESGSKEEKPDILSDILSSPGANELPEPDLDNFLTASSATTSAPATKVDSESPGQDLGYKDILGEFDVIGRGEPEPHRGHTGNSAALLHSLLEPEEELDDEFAALAADSLAKSPQPPKKEEEEEAEPEEDDPFNTEFVEKVLVEEKEPEPEPIVEQANDDEDDFDFDPRANEPARLSPPREPSLLEDHTPTVDNLPVLDPQFRAKAPTGSLVDHSDPRVPTENEVVIDPFDSSSIKVGLPGRAELRQLEEELLNAEVVPLTAKVTQLHPKFSAPPKPAQEEEEDDFDFNPRGEETKLDHPFDQGEPDPSQESDNVLLPQQEEEAELDPFDTNFCSGLNLGPGQLELKLLASELVGSGAEDHTQTQADGTSGLEQLQLQQEDFDFDPRGEEEPDPFVVVVKKGILKTEDIFGDHHEEFYVGADANTALIPRQKGDSPPPQPVNTAGVEGGPDHEEEDVDPFDTSSIEVIKLLPPSELKAIEGEILSAPHFPTTAPQVILKAAFSAPARPQEWTELKPQLTVDEEAAEKPHLLEEEDLFHSGIEHKPLTPLELESDFDPFCTKFAEGVVPGKTEIRILEQELQLGIDGLSGRRLSDPDFDPRGATVVSAPQPIHPASLSYVSKVLQPTPHSIPAGGLQESENIPNQQDLKALEAELL